MLLLLKNVDVREQTNKKCLSRVRGRVLVGSWNQKQTLNPVKTRLSFAYMLIYKYIPRQDMYPDFTTKCEYMCKIVFYGSHLQIVLKWNG